MRRLTGMLFCCLLLFGCRASERHATEPAGLPAEEAPRPREDTHAALPVPGERFDRAREFAAIHFFTLTEQAAGVAAVLVRAALIGLYVVLFPVVGFGAGGPG